MGDQLFCVLVVSLAVASMARKIYVYGPSCLRARVDWRILLFITLWMLGSALHVFGDPVN